MGLNGSYVYGLHPYYTTDPYQLTLLTKAVRMPMSPSLGGQQWKHYSRNWDSDYSLSGTHGVGVLTHAIKV